MRTINRLLRSVLLMITLTTLACPAKIDPSALLPPINPGPISIELQTVASGLTSPTYLTHAGDNSGRLFITDQVGKIWLVKNGQLATNPFLDISDRIVALNPTGDEQGLESMAFHPGFADPTSPGFGKLYTYQCEPISGSGDFSVPLPLSAKYNHQNVLTEWQVDPNNPDVVDRSSARDVFRSNHPSKTHNAGQLAFGPDGFLYISIGDGGCCEDMGPGHSSQGNGQDTSNILGKILRIDPLSPTLTDANIGPESANGHYRIPADNPFIAGGGAGEIFAYGFRNPYRFSFDSQTADLVVADVGQDNVEEVDIVIKGGNYGWPLKEGSFSFNRQANTVSTNTSGLPAGLIDPVLEYDHTQGDAIIGGFVYRGAAIPELAGQYVFGDLSLDGTQPRGRLFYGSLAGGQIQELVIGATSRPLGLWLKGFGRDQQGDLYVLGGPQVGPTGTSAVVQKIVPLGP
jgi:glucose/arabinose dehydrogenase